MALTASISVAQGDDNALFTITDTSNYAGADTTSNITSRQLILYKSDGSVYRQPAQDTDEIDFSYANYPSNVIEIAGLTKDLALSATMVLTPIAAQTGSVYSVTVKFAVVGFTATAIFERHKKQAIQPRYEKDKAYTNDTHRLVVESRNAVVAAAGDDITGAQLSLDRAYRIIQDNKLPY